MFAAIAGVLSARSRVNSTIEGPLIDFPPTLSAMPSTAKTAVITEFPIQAKTGFGIALATNITAFPVNISAGGSIALASNVSTFPVNLTK
jgi:hypothetical protein